MIHLLRHGHAENQRKNLLCGDKDFPLTEKGTVQANQFANNCRVGLEDLDYIYCSSVKRCVETIKEFRQENSQTPYILSDELREINVGDLALEDYDSVTETIEFSGLGYHSGKRFPNGETFEEFQKRVLHFFDSIDMNANNLIVTHSGVINIFLHHLYNVELKYFPFFNIKNCHLYSFKTS